MEKKYLDINGLTEYDALIKAFIDAKIFSDSELTQTQQEQVQQMIDNALLSEITGEV